jgi:hypothetical protein
MVKIHRNKVGYIDALFTADNSASRAFETLKNNLDVSKKWEKQVRVVVYGDSREQIIEQMESYFGELSSLQGFLKMETSIVEALDFYLGEEVCE